MIPYGECRRLLADKEETIDKLKEEVASLKLRYQNEIFYKTQAEKEVAELKEKNKQLLKENVELLQQMRKILKEAESDGRTQDVCKDDN